MNNSQFKHIFSDVDGTLIHSKNNRPYFDSRLIKRINDLHKYQVGFSIATGRHYQDVLLMLEKNAIKYVNYIIGMTGAQIFDFQKKQLIFNAVFNQKQISQIKEVYQYLKSNYFNHYTMFIYSHNNKNGYEIDSIDLINDESDVFIRNISKYIERMCTNIDYLNLHICKKAVFSQVYKVAFNFYKNALKNDDFFRQIKKELENLKHNALEFVECGKCYLEITAKGIDKGSAIDYVIKNKLKLDTNTLICFGDSDNDLPMFDLIENSVTRTTASENIVKKAKYIIDNHPSAFVLEGIDKLVLNK